MKDTRAIKPFAMKRIKAVTLGQKKSEGTRSRSGQRLANRPGRVELSRRAASIVALRMVFDRVPLLPERHLGIEVWQMIKRPRSPHRQLVRRIQREKPNARNALAMNIGAHVEFVKSAGAGNWEQERATNTPHRERHHSDPGFTVEGVD